MSSGPAPAEVRSGVRVMPLCRVLETGPVIRPCEDDVCVDRETHGGFVRKMPPGDEEKRQSGAGRFRHTKFGGLLAVSFFTACLLVRQRPVWLVS